MKEANIKHYVDLINPKFKGFLVIGDCEKSTGYLYQYMALRKILPLSYFRQLAAQGITAYMGGRGNHRP